MDDPATRGDPPASAPTAVAPARPGPFSQPVSRGVFILLAAALVAAVVVGWIAFRNAQRDMRMEVGKRLAEADAALAQARTRESDLGNELREAQAKLALLETRVSESQTQQASLEALYRELAPSRDELALNEVEQILLLASQQLAIANNVQAALAALQLADAKLSRVDRPQLVPLRRALARDIDRLKAVPYVDVPGMSLKLDQAIALVATLPLARDERLPAAPAPPPPADEPPWLRFLREAWGEVKSLVRIEVADRPAAPLVPPAQEYYLRENLRLRLLSARVALLSHDDSAFKGDVTAANAWIKQYFDTRTKPVQALVATLTQLAATPMPAELPDVAASLTALRSLKAARERASAGQAPR
ncbi:MAG TPA: uroporphyrinogen-III C-methyltransferase [Casimicrobiaceae bacterium]|nr:uroporphyrinogen-III C-methyltransferase [Casimicrobiaceae bacterium]